MHACAECMHGVAAVRCVHGAALHSTAPHRTALQGEKGPAEQELVRATTLQDNGQPSVLGLVALAHVQYQQDKFKEAIRQ